MGPGSSMDCGVSGMGLETQWVVSGDLCRLPHVHLSALLVYQHFGAFYTHPKWTNSDKGGRGSKNAIFGRTSFMDAP